MLLFFDGVLQVSLLRTANMLFETIFLEVVRAVVYTIEHYKYLSPAREQSIARPPSPPPVEATPSRSIPR